MRKNTHDSALIVNADYSDSDKWVSGRIKDFVEVNPNTIVPRQLKFVNEIEFVPMTNVDDKTGTVKKFDYEAVENVIKGYTKFKNGDVIFAKITPCMENGNCAVISNLKYDIGFGSTEFIVLRPSKKVLADYLHLFLYDKHFRLNAEPFMRGTAGQKRISTHYIVNHDFSLPPLKEQHSIVEDLKRKCEIIDANLALLINKRDGYIELKDALIDSAVTQGIDKRHEYKSSGIGWVGKIPKNWMVDRIGTAFKERRERVNDTDYPPLSVTKNGIVSQLDNAAKTDHNDNRKRVCKNDFVINSRSDRRGSSGVSSMEGSVSVINIVLEPQESFFPQYLHYLFRSNKFIEEFYRVGRGIVDDLWTTKYSVMKSIEFAYPGYDEQESIAHYLDSKVKEIDNIVELLEIQIKNYKECRDSTIHEVVNNKVGIN